MKYGNICSEALHFFQKTCLIEVFIWNTHGYLYQIATHGKKS